LGRYSLGRGGGSTPNVPDTVNPQGFNIGSSAQMTFAASGNNYGSVLNIDASGNSSEIDGILNANHLNFYLANGNGVVVGAGATINAAAQLGFIGWSMDSATSADDFVGNNSNGRSYLDFGSIGTPGAVTIGANANVKAGTTQVGNDGAVLLLGGTVTNDGNITVQAPDPGSWNGFVLAAAGWVPTKTTDTIGGVSATPVYRAFDLQRSGSLYNINLVPGTSSTGGGFLPATGNYQVVNNGSIAVTRSLAAQSWVNAYEMTALLGINGVTDNGSISSNEGPIMLSTVYPAAGANNSISINGPITSSADGTIPDPVALDSSSYGYGVPGSSGGAGIAIYAPGSSVKLGSSANLSANSTAVMALNLQGANGTTPVNTNYFTAFITGTINAPGSSDFLNNGLGVAPYTAGQTVEVDLYSAAAANDPTSQNFVNLNITGNANINSAGTWSPIAGQIDQTFYNGNASVGNPLATDASGNYSYATAALADATFNPAGGVKAGGSLIIQASGNLAILGGSNGYVYNGAPGQVNSELFANAYDKMFNNAFDNASNNNAQVPGSNYMPFVFSGGVVFKAGQSVEINVPVINAWGSQVIAYQGVFLESPVITVNNDAFFVTGPAMRVNVSTTPTTGVPTVFLESGGSMTQSPGNYLAAMGSGVYKNAYSALINAYINNPATWVSVVNSTPM
jgi:filamentous hemagglutinin family protein